MTTRVAVLLLLGSAAVLALSARLLTHDRRR
jgi:hypothetical protein